MKRKAPVDSNWQRLSASIGTAPKPAKMSRDSPMSVAAAGAGHSATAAPRSREERDNAAFITAPFPPAQRNAGLYPDVTVTKFLGVDCEMVRLSRAGAPAARCLPRPFRCGMGASVRVCCAVQGGRWS